MIIAAREPSGTEDFDGLPELIVGGLGDDDARHLLAQTLQGRIDERVRDRIVAESRGNPLALLELPRGLTPAQLAGGFRVPDTGSLSPKIEQSFLRRFASLGATSQQLLLLAAAEPLGDATLLWRAAERLGIGAEALDGLEGAGLVEVGLRVRFRHPLVRSAVYRAAAVEDRQRTHRALAEATDPEADPDRRAWHRAYAAAGLDESVAGDLERSAARAQRRGGVAAAAAFLERAAELTPAPHRRAERTLAAAQAKLEAGAPDAANALLDAAALVPLDDLQRALVRRTRAEVAFTVRRGSDVAALLLDAAKGLVGLDASQARKTCLEALGAALHAGDVIDRRDVMEILHGAPAPRSPRPDDLLLDGLATRVVEGYTAGAPPLRAALEAFRRDDGGDAEVDRWLWLACRAATDLWDIETWSELARRAVRLAREAGALDVLPIAATYLAGAHMNRGEYAAAATLMEESSAITRATGASPLVVTEPVLAARRGDPAASVPLLEGARRDTAARGLGMPSSMLDATSAALFNALGRYEEAWAAAERGCAVDELSLYASGLVELVEAAVHSGRPEIARAAFERLRARTQASGTDWALGLEARSQALLTDGAAARALYEEAIARLTRADVAPYLARAQLVYGEWLRREQHRREARDQLGAAHDAFVRLEAGAWAERARRELAATGATVRKRTVETRDALTAQESQIARLAAEGHTNPEIAAQLFISPRTVEYHLGKIYPKLNIGSRRELRTALTCAEPA